MPYWRLYYHLVWATKDRQSLLVGEVAEVVERSVRATCHDRGVVVHALGMMPDHLHLATSIPPSIAVGTFVGLVKGSASHLINHDGVPGIDGFGWQREYGALSFGERALADVVAYVTNQPARHAANTVIPALERVDGRKPQAPGPQVPG